MDRIEDIEVFVEVAGRGSFSAAARRLNRSPTAVTRAVAELEARLGVRLLNRTTRAVSLTDAGERFLAGARRVLSDLAEIEQAAAGQGIAPRGELAITAPMLFGRLHVLPIVNEFLGAYPDVTARLLLLDRPVDLIEERLDAAIRIGSLADSSAIATKLGGLCRVVVAAPDYLERRGTPRHPDDVASHDVVVFGGLGGGRWDLGPEGSSVRVTPRLTVTTAEAAMDAVEAGLGITRVLKKLGMAPNMMRVMANNPTVLGAYLAFSGALAGGRLGARLHARIALAVAQANGCDYCLAAHTLLGKGAGLADSEIIAARKGTATDRRDTAALTLAGKLLAQRGKVSSDDLDAARAASLTDADIVEIIAAVAINVFTNYTNVASDTDIDFPLAAKLDA